MVGGRGVEVAGSSVGEGVLEGTTISVVGVVLGVGQGVGEAVSLAAGMKMTVAVGLLIDACRVISAMTVWAACVEITAGSRVGTW
jgi:hypothetical protein